MLCLILIKLIQKPSIQTDTVGGYNPKWNIHHLESLKLSTERWMLTSKGSTSVCIVFSNNDHWLPILKLHYWLLKWNIEVLREHCLIIIIMIQITAVLCSSQLCGMFQHLFWFTLSTLIFIVFPPWWAAFLIEKYWDFLLRRKLEAHLKINATVAPCLLDV